LPEPGPNATKGPVNLTGKNVTLIMDSNYLDTFTYFRVCRYNRSSHTLISCCAYQKYCEWGEFSDQSEPNHPSCQLNTSQPGLYQFLIMTINYPCYFNIGDPIDVSSINYNSDNQFNLNFHILAYALGGLSLILVLGIPVTFCSTRRYYKRIRLQAQLGMLISLIPNDVTK